VRTACAFLLFVAFGGLGAFVGSVLGAALGHSALFIGAIIGGLVAAPAAAGVGVRSGWIDARDHAPAAWGAAIGFLAASAIAVATISSAIGPMLSTLVIGAGGLAGPRLRDALAGRARR
jgi:hypothetical protein